MSGANPDVLKRSASLYNCRNLFITKLVDASSSVFYVSRFVYKIWIVESIKSLRSVSIEPSTS